MHPDEAAFLAAICAEPADDTPRLVFADWLQENGQEARAEFIRVQCELARLPTGLQCCHKPDLSRPNPNVGEALWYCGDNCPLCRRIHCENRQSALWNQRGYVSTPTGFIIASLTGDYFGRLDSHRVAIYSRGFAAEISCPAADWLAHADAITAVHPVTRVTLTTLFGISDMDGADGMWWFTSSPDYKMLNESYNQIANNLEGNFPNYSRLAALMCRWPRITFTLPS